MREVQAAEVVGTSEERDSEGRWVVQAKEILRMIESGEDVVIENGVIRGYLDLNKAHLKKDDGGKFIVKPLIKVISSEILGTVNFNNTVFLGNVDFSRTKFEDDVNFIDSQFKFSSRFFRAEFNRDANFCDAKFNRSDFKRVKFFSDANFTGAQFEVDADFAKAEFCDFASFEKVEFKMARFLGVLFGGVTNFKGVLFTDNAYFGDADFIVGVAFEGGQFGNDTDFARANFKGYTNFMKVQFRGINNFMGAKFGDTADFGEAQFIGNVNFVFACFTDAIFKKTMFNGDVQFVGVRFSGNVLFDEMKFAGDNSDFRWAQFDAKAYFHKVLFCCNACFSETRFNDGEFDEVEFQEKLNLDGATISRLRLEEVKFAEKLEKLSEEKSVSMKTTIFTQLFVNWDQFEQHLEYNGATFLAFVKNFKALENFKDADNCYYRYRSESRKNKSWWDNEKRLKNRFNLSKLYDSVSLGSCGYGVRPGFTVACIFGSIFGFLLLYYFLGGITKSSPPEITMKAMNNSTLLFAFVPSETSPSFWECLYFSALSFVGGTPAGLSPVGAWKYAVMFESVFGYLLLALFIVVLARKLIR